ncbi:hypothetical protein VU10_05440 [Desulfobulbus sp. US1]|nr:hypothetical protein [Desulfobulbus sp. US4]MCW5209613.1 hypothetical protein [Desulfobulbus sp. US1]WLE98982.1 MAG: hypothetical protein QTN59_09120 [Candidatus Electrothrix communis]
MKKFVLYYKEVSLSHTRLHGAIEAESPTYAFVEAVGVMHEKGLDPDEFKEFYIAPVEIDRSIGYRKQCHGWDEYGEYPR